jgi:hypothetical protein
MDAIYVVVHPRTSVSTTSPLRTHYLNSRPKSVFSIMCCLVNSLENVWLQVRKSKKVGYSISEWRIMCKGEILHIE